LKTALDLFLLVPLRVDIQELRELIWSFVCLCICLSLHLVTDLFHVKAMAAPPHVVDSFCVLVFSSSGVDKALDTPGVKWLPVMTGNRNTIELGGLFKRL
jgi:hypothetical protein